MADRLHADTREEMRLELREIVTYIRILGDTLERAYGRDSGQVVAARRGAVWIERLAEMLTGDASRDALGHLLALTDDPLVLPPRDDEGRGRP
jgi:hypothetical protein